MKQAVLVMAVTTLAGCVSASEHGWHERCASYGMVMGGMNLSADTANASATAVGSGPSGIYVGRATTTVTSNGENASCRLPATRQETCELGGWVASAEVKDAWDPDWRNAVIFVGFVALIAPGVIASLYFHSDEDAVEVNAKKAWTAAYGQCIGKTSRSGPPGAQ